MYFTLHSLLVTSGLLFAISSPTAGQTPSTPPTPELAALAKQTLEAAGAMAAATPPDFQPGALLQLGTIVSTFDSKKGKEYYEQAFAASAILPTESKFRMREEFQALLASQVARQDLNRALEILLMMPAPSNEQDPRLGPLTEIVKQWIARKNVDRAMAVLEQFIQGGNYPYDAVRLVLKALPAGEERRQTLVSQAIVSFQQRPEVDPFTTFLRDFRPEMTSVTYETGTRLLAKALMNGKGLPEPYSQTITTNNGTVTLVDPQEIAIFNAWDVVVEVDPLWAKQYLESHQELKQAIDRFPKGQATLNMGAEGVTTRGTVRPGMTTADVRQRAQVLAVETMKFQEVMRNLRNDPDQALRAAKDIPSPQLQVRALDMIASIAGSKEPPEARSLLDKVIVQLEAMKAPEWRANAWGGIAMAAARIKDQDLALKALEKGLADARAMYKLDANADDPNLAPRSAWPSTMIYKSLFFRAAKALGADAPTLLEKIPDAEIQLMARVEMAAAWLNVPSSPTYSQNRRAPKR